MSLRCCPRSTILKWYGISLSNNVRKSKIATQAALWKNISGLNPSKDEWITRSPFSDVVVPEGISISEYIFNKVEDFADRSAIVDGESGQDFKYKEVRTLSLRLANSLTSLGFGKGDIVGLISPNCPEFVIIMMALNAIGAIVSPINFIYTAEEIKYHLGVAECVGVICHQDKLSVIREACQNNSRIRHIISTGPEETGILSLRKLQIDSGKELPSCEPVNSPEDIAVIPFSSGTTGWPKGVMLTNRSILANIQQMLHPDLRVLDYDGSQQVQISLIPMSHALGMWKNLTGMYMGCKIITMKSFQPDLFIGIMSKYKPTSAPVVPPILHFLANSPKVSPNLLDSVQVMQTGAAPMSKELQEKLETKFSSSSMKIIEGYGMTEMSPTTHSTAGWKVTAGSVGVPVPNTSTKLVDSETGAPVGPDIRVGELCIKGPQMMKGYFKNAKATQETIKDGWLHTGDVARIDENGLTFIVDRIKELIKVKGLQVSPSELEGLIKKFPGVDDVAVIGVPNERTGELPRAFVVPKKDATLKEEEVKQFVATKVSAHKHLDKVIFIDEIPKSTAGKILRKDLRKLL